MFGFSRGAFTVRSLCGFISYAGLLKKEHLSDKAEPEEVKRAYAAYRTPDEGQRRNHAWLRSEAATRAYRDVPIQFLGVFDTVGALGIPVGWIERACELLVPEKNNRFHNTQLGANVKCACHALAVDERRGPFQPTLWTGSIESNQHVLQIWFAGVHSDVGGGYKDKQLADVALEWMLGEAEGAGLTLRRGFGPEGLDPSAAGKIHQSVTLGYRLAHFLPSIDFYRRPIGAAQRSGWFGGEPDPVTGEKVHWSIVDRVEGDAAEVLLQHGETYRPPSLVPPGEHRIKVDVEIYGKDDAPEANRKAS